MKLVFFVLVLFFRFRFNRKSIEYLSELPYAKHDGGHIIFTNSKNEHSVLRLTCVWRGKTLQAMSKETLQAMSKETLKAM